MHAIMVTLIRVQSVSSDEFYFALQIMTYVLSNVFYFALKHIIDLNAFWFHSWF